MTQFGEEEEIKTLTSNIRKLICQIQRELRILEKNIKIYINPEFFEYENTFQIQIKDNMNQNLVQDLNIFNHKFKLSKENYSQKAKELLQEDESDNFFEMSEATTINSDNNEIKDNNVEKNFLMTVEPDSLLKYRENEINQIVQGVNVLDELFRDLNIIVIEQGTILDRIDYNIDITYDNVGKGKTKIIMANESQKNSCFRNVILIILLCIFIETTLILLKFF